ncbi:MAG: glycosyl hydrolase, partial [Brevundimonas sp.]
MTKSKSISSLALAVAIGLAPMGVAAQAARPAAARSATDADQSAVRADALLARMTRDEKLQLIHGYFPPMAARTPGAPVADMIPSA